MKLGVALGGGGARALGGLGVMAVLEREGIKPAMITGSSMGAVIAAMYASQGETATLRAWFEKNGRWALPRLIKPSKLGVIDASYLRAMMVRFYKKERFSELRIPLRVTATSLNRCAPVVFDKGPLIDAVLASSAIPGVFPPVKIGDDWFVDGQITNPTPVDLIPANFGHILGVDFATTAEKLKKSPNVLDVLERSYEAARVAFVTHRAGRENCTIITPYKKPGLEFLSFDKSKEFIAIGEEFGEKLIRDWKRKGLYGQLRN